MSHDNVAPFGRHTTVVKTSVHSTTDSSLLGDGVRLLVRSMKKIAKLAGDAGIRLRDRSLKLGCSILRGRHVPSLRQTWRSDGVFLARRPTEHGSSRPPR